MINRSLVRRKSLTLLFNRFLPAMLLTLIAEVITISIQYLQTGLISYFGVPSLSNEDMLSQESLMAFVDKFMENNRNIVVVLTVFLALFVFSFIISAPLKFGTLKWYRETVNGKRENIGFALNSYASLKSIASSIGLYIYLGLNYLKWALLIFAGPVSILTLGLFLSKTPDILALLILLIGIMLLPGAIALYVLVTNKYFLTPYIYAAGNCTVIEATRDSINIMRDKNKGLFVFQLQLLPILLLASVACYGVGAIIATPFVNMCYAVYADEILKIENGETTQNENIEFTVE